MSIVQGACLLLRGHAFVPILKNGSSSMGWALSQAGAKEDNFIRYPEILIHHQLSVILRDPVERFISTYDFIDWQPGTPDEVLADMYRDELYTPQFWYLADYEPELVGPFPPTDFMRLGLDIPHFNKGTRPSRFAKYDSPQMRRRIELLYAEDMELCTRYQEET